MTDHSKERQELDKNLKDAVFKAIELETAELREQLIKLKSKNPWNFVTVR